MCLDSAKFPPATDEIWSYSFCLTNTTPSIEADLPRSEALSARIEHYDVTIESKGSSYPTLVRKPPS